jgi:hypothetical protein
MRLTPITLDEAKRFVGRHHRHNAPPVSWKFGVGLTVGDSMVGVAIAGRPVGRGLDKPGNIEITRVCVQETKNGNSRLYGAITRAAAALGYETAYTYTLQSESGASLKASGFVIDEELPARPTWDTPSRRRQQTDMFGNERRPPEAKIRWKKELVRAKSWGPPTTIPEGTRNDKSRSTGR